jgi:hypothetical protein
MYCIINNVHKAHPQISTNSPANLKISQSQWKWRVFSVRADLWPFRRSSLIAILPLPLANGMELERISEPAYSGVVGRRNGSGEKKWTLFVFADVFAGFEEMLA